MGLLNKKEIKIFFTFFVFYSYFIIWPGMNENSRFFLTRAIVDESRFEIDSFYNQTSDRALINGHYYSEKAPGGSFFAVPVYASWKFIYQNFFPKTFKDRYSEAKDYLLTSSVNEKIIIYKNPGFFVLSSMIFVTIFTSSLFSSLSVILIYKISRYFINKESHSIFLTIVYGLGTLTFHYALVFLGHAIGTFFIFLSFYLLFKMKKEKYFNLKYFFLSGLSAGLAIISDYPTGLIALGCFIIVLSFKEKFKTFYFILGLFFGLMPLLLYNYTIFGIPFELTAIHTDPAVIPPASPHLYKGLALSYVPSLPVSLKLLFYPYRGLFYYYPIFFLSLLGLFYMYKEYKLESIMILLFFLIYVVIFSSFEDWWHGSSFGFRHILPMIPFLVLPLSFVIKKDLWVLIIFFVVISIFNNFIGLVGEYDDILRYVNGEVLPEYKDKLYSFDNLPNPLYNFYLPKFLMYGPRSKIFEFLSNKEFLVDIRVDSPSKIENFPVEKRFFIPYLSLIPLLVFFFIIWRKEFLKLTLKYFHFK